MRLQGKVALITGTGSGIGRATALRFAAEGAQIVAVDIADSNEDTVTEVQRAGGEAIAVHADVSDDADVAAAFGRAEDVYGGLDVAFNNAGIMLDDDTDAIATGEETIDRT
ncbi:MAG: SDR family oxidoreductase, partial [Acidimicrobiales bacterium]|nr:SDR family oxidoreductase [Acidimicrobiales bacterium]